MTLYAAIVGASLWILTEILEMLAPAGHTALSLWVTTAWHPILAIGFWGLHKAQSPGRNTLSLVAAVVVIVGLIVFAPLSVMFLNSGAASFDVFVQDRPFFAASGLLMVIGLVLFSIAAIRTRYYAAWMAYGVIAAVVLVAVKSARELPEIVQHARFIILSLMIIGMAVTGLQTNRLETQGKHSP